MTLTIRPMTLEDGPYLIRWLDDPAILRWFPMSDEREIADAVRIWVGYSALRGGLTACIDGVPIGNANLNLQPFQKLAHQCLVTVIVENRYRGQGIGRRLLEALLVVAKEEHKMDFVHLEVYDGNPAIRLYERLGFAVYGRHKRFIKMGNEYIDKVCMQREV